MKHTLVSLTAKAALLVTALALPACAPTTRNIPESQVAQAFETSGAILMKPYTRTIFSNNDF
jgi:hypothetical protein